jgi:hypothetical protein
MIISFSGIQASLFLQPVYNNENELIIHEVIYGKRILTNVRAIRAELDILLEKMQ